MQNNQNNQQSGQQGGQKPQQSLSWSQPAVGQQNQAKSTALATPGNAQANTPGSRMALMFVIGLVIGWLITWSWFDLRSNHNSSISSNATSTSETSGATGIAETQSGASPATGTVNGSSTAQTTAGANSAAGQVSSDTITVPSPQNAGTDVTVSNIATDAAVWAAVYEDNNGKPGRVLGAARFHLGETSGTIGLLRSTLPNLSYFVGLVADTPDHTFDVHTNAPLLDQNGNQIMAQFTAR